jgi:hypothetical protein
MIKLTEECRLRHKDASILFSVNPTRPNCVQEQATKKQKKCERWHKTRISAQFKKPRILQRTIELPVGSKWLPHLIRSLSDIILGRTDKFEADSFNAKMRFRTGHSPCINSQPAAQGVRNCLVHHACHHRRGNGRKRRAGLPCASLRRSA